MIEKIEGFINEHGTRSLCELITVAMDEDYAKCDDDQCDNEGCRLRKAFDKWQISRNEYYLDKDNENKDNV